jgi:ABC-type nitrate/sulfonate/bicarbonate transport system substrate-binding protein
LRTAAGATVLLLVLGACSRPAAQNTSAEDQSAPLKIAVGIDSTYAPYFLADSEGMFEDAGLDVELVQFGRGSEAVDALVAGEVEMAGSSDATTVTQFQQNPGLRALYATQRSGKYVKVVLRNGVKEAGQIEKMAVVPGLSEVAAAAYLQSQGVSREDVEFVTVTPNEASPLMGRGDVDGFVMWEPWPSTAVQDGVGQVAASTGDYGWNYNHWLISTQDHLDQGEADAQALADVLAEAAKRVEEDPDAAVAAVVAATDVPEDQVRQAIDEIDYQVRAFREEDIEAASASAAYFVESGVLKERPDLESGIVVDWIQE